MAHEFSKSASAGTYGTNMGYLDYADQSTEDDVTGTSATVYAVTIDATDNPGEDVTFRAYNNASPTVGTTLAILAIRCRAGQTVSLSNIPGWAFGTSLSFCVTTEKEGDAGTGTAPSGRVKVWIDYT